MTPRSQPLSGDGLLAVLNELLGAQSLTPGELRARLVRYPELLGDEAQRLLRILEGIQESPGAQRHVVRVATLLARLRTEDMESVLVQEGTQIQRRRIEERRTARLRAARESFLVWRQQENVGARVDSGRLLPSLSEVVADLQDLSVKEPPQPFGFDILTAQPTSKSAPSFLFRGESAAFPKTNASIARLRASGALLPNALVDIDRICEALVHRLGETWSLTNAQALGFLQHYGYPTEFIDLTSDVSVAASFASWLRVGDEGAMCVVPSKYLSLRDNLIDLRYHPLAHRPRRQSAFAVHLQEFSDLKSSEAIEAMGLRWIPFRFTEIDAARFAPDFGLLDARSDAIAGLIWLMIGDSAKFDDAAAKLISRRIDPARIFGVVLQDGSMAFLSEDDAAIIEEGLSDDAFRQTHYEQWSTAHAEIDRQPLPPELETVFVKESRPGSVVRIMSTRAFAAVRRKTRGHDFPFGNGSS